MDIKFEIKKVSQLLPGDEVYYKTGVDDPLNHIELIQDVDDFLHILTYPAKVIQVNKGYGRKIITDYGITEMKHYQPVFTNAKIQVRKKIMSCMSIFTTGKKNDTKYKLADHERDLENSVKDFKKENHRKRFPKGKKSNNQGRSKKVL